MGTALRGTVVMILTLVPLVAAVVVAIEAIRTGRFVLGDGRATDAIPEDFYETDSFLPPALLDGAGWVIGACIVWIVAVALLAGLGSLRRTATRRAH